MMKLISVSKKASIILVPLTSIILGLGIGAIAMLWSGFDPLVAYKALFTGILGDFYSIGETIRTITPLIFTGLAVTFAFRTGLFNIGVEGQFIVGQLAGAWAGIYFGQFGLPWIVHVPLAMTVAFLAGALWAGIPGLLKAVSGAHEVITTIMMNHISLIFVNFLIRDYLRIPTREATADVAPSADLTIKFLHDLFQGARLHWGTFIGLLIAIVVYVLLWKTTTGYELRAVGHNLHAAEYAGINVRKNIILSMAISGGIAGIGGAVETMGVFKSMAVSAVFPGVGFDGIAVALIGNNHPFGVILGAILLGSLKNGSINMAFSADVPTAVVRIVIASIIFFTAASGLVKWMLRLKHDEGV